MKRGICARHQSMEGRARRRTPAAAKAARAGIAPRRGRLMETTQERPEKREEGERKERAAQLSRVRLPLPLPHIFPFFPRESKAPVRKDAENPVRSSGRHVGRFAPPTCNAHHLEAAPPRRRGPMTKKPNAGRKAGRQPAGWLLAATRHARNKRDRQTDREDTDQKPGWMSETDPEPDMDSERVTVRHVRSKCRCSCVLQFTLRRAVSCVLHRPPSQVIRCIVLCVFSFVSPFPPFGGRREAFLRAWMREPKLNGHIGSPFPVCVDGERG